MTLAEALEILRLDGEYTAEAVAAAYRRRAKECHPDAGGSMEEMVRLNQARDVVMDAIKNGWTGPNFFSGTSSGFSGFGADIWEHLRRRYEESRRGEQERQQNEEWDEWKKQREERKKRREALRLYTKGAKAAFKRDVSRFKEMLSNVFKENDHNPAVYAAFIQLLNEAGYSRTETGYQRYEEFYAVQKRFQEIYTDSSTYQARFRQRKDGSFAGPYWYRVVKDKEKGVRYEYVGRRLPETAYEEPSAEKRKEKCMEMARKWVKEKFY
ncbi:hypothetical protein G7K71_02805 [Desulfofundulus sp. TPOSR]|uniref:hypothetical protein n=1 Tax=Desulfofundulus sp. TPOSR TaxID=2714340 RepID=UPI00140887F9|nr:hypothetical protein [Desulfofundulus sp. TPOSR]NHM25956.1 hypothetical protein [Desulfofundulus sp. TPOSR]